MKTKALAAILTLVAGVILAGCGGGAGDVKPGDGTAQSSGSSAVRGAVSAGTAGGGTAPDAGTTLATE